MMTDCSADSVMIFSNRGGGEGNCRIIGWRGEGRGNVIFPTGIATDREDRIIAVSRTLKMYSNILNAN